MPLIWDKQIGAFKEAAPPLLYDPAIGAYRETEGYAHNPQLDAWKKLWPQELYLYKDGDEYEDVTGGWITTRGTITRGIGDIIYRSTDLTRNDMSTAFPVDLSNCRLLCIRYKSIVYALGTTTDAVVTAGVSSARDTSAGCDIVDGPIFNNRGAAHLAGLGTYNDVAICMDIQAGASVYIKPVLCNAVAVGSSRTITATIDRIWLE